MPTFKTVTLGCKVNQYETAYVRQGLIQLGYREAERTEPADLYLINTCTVTATGDHKSRKAIRQAAKENPAARIVVMGCYATRAADEVVAMPGVTDVLTDKRDLPALLQRLGLADPARGLHSSGSRHRVYVKVQDGCRMACSYCIIPHVRPVLISRPIEDVVDEVRALVGCGHREIVLTGIHLGHYGVDLDGQAPRPDLASLVRAVSGLDDLDRPMRVRISSLEAAEVTPELLEVMAARPERICPHLHLSMQSGSDAVLRRMQRRQTADEFVEQCRQAQRMLDQPALTTDAIVGFPGETEADFEATCRVVEAVGFSKVHVFPFSPRQGTPAAEMPDQVPVPIRHARAARLAEVAAPCRTAYARSLVGRRLQVLVESPVAARPGRVVGTSDRYLPVELPGNSDLLGQLVSVTITDVLADDTLDGRP
ncbi:MAG: tRNA (N(6)-L-threonylcarbamoyladenosine(37)-C(2))-methylthiotransferase MtaB [Pirellulales bacterium]|nr:tRNA (N(6)-L-threonylcarbamoyladenosine(37)-C(2))-methylthiotransferase MtaB [Pirellulales bacterium]